MGALDLGIDLGTTKTIIYKAGSGILLREPSVVAINTRDDSVVAVGEEALRMLGRTPGYIRAEYPLRDGVISDHLVTEVMLKEFIRRACSSFLVKHRIVICIPSLVTDVERRAVIDAVINAGGRHCYLIEEPISAAIGAGIDISKPDGNLIVDIGGGTADVAVISLSGVVLSKSLKFAGNRLDDNIIKLVAAKYKLSIGKKTAESLKREIGCIWRPSADRSAEIRGRDLLTGYPRTTRLSSQDLFEAVAPFGEALLDTIHQVLERTPPELTGDILKNGIILTGGGALLDGLPELVTDATGIPARLAENPVECVSIGTGKAFDYIGKFASGFSDEPNIRI